jgi:hypothetical protein
MTNMRLFKLPLLALALCATLFSCSKGDDEDNDPDCLTDNTTQVSFTNTSSIPLRVEVASRLTPQLEAIDPVVTLDLAAGESATKTFAAGRYMMVWRTGCPSNCLTVTGALGRDFESCEEYQEKAPTY